MDGPELLKALMDAAGENAYAVATSLKKAALQSYIWKFTNGKAKEPRRASLQPLADRYRVPVEAFYDPALATQVAIERGLVKGEISGAPPQATRPEADLVADALATLADVLARADKATRSAISASFSLLATDPNELENVVATVKKLLPAGELARASQDDRSTGLVFKDLGSGDLNPDGKSTTVQRPRRREK